MSVLVLTVRSAAMTAMHEEVHQRADEQDQIGHKAASKCAWCSVRRKEPPAVARARKAKRGPESTFKKSAWRLLPFMVAPSCQVIFIRRKRRALLTTETEERLMAAAAMIGESRMPKKG